MRWSRGGSSGALAGRWTRIAGLCCAVLFAALMPAARAEIARQDADVTLGYACRLPSGPQQVTVRIRASFPARGEPSAAIQPSDAAVTVTFPRDVAGEVLGPDAATVTGNARLGVLATQAGLPVGTEWTGMPIASTGASRPLRITAAGPVPPSTARAQGDVIFSAGALVLRLDVRRSGGTPATAAPTALECMPNLGQSTTLVTVPLVGDADQGGPGAQGAQAAPGTGTPGVPAGGPRTLDDFCPPPPDPPRLNDKLRPLFPPLPPGSIDETQQAVPEHFCATVDGLSNVNKQKGAAPVRGLTSVFGTLEIWVRRPDPTFPDAYQQQRFAARTDLIPAEATFLTFGFMPTTAKMEITQIGNMNIAVEGQKGIQIATGIAEVSIRAFDVRINGTPMDVGPNCRTADGMLLVATGRSDAEEPYNLNAGGVLTGTAEIPPFTGCGTGGDDLDRLLTASISGPGNFLRLVQGATCKPTAGSVPSNPCPPGAYGFTITPGGEFRGTLTATPDATPPAPPVIIRLGSLPTSPRITCRTSTITGTLRSGRQIAPDRLGQVTGFSLGDCAGDRTLAGHTFTISSTGLPVKLAESPVGDIVDGILPLEFRVPRLHVASDFCSLDIVPTGTTQTAMLVRVRYNVTDRQLQLTLISGSPRNASSGCPGTGNTSVISPPGFYTGIVQDFKFGGELPPLP